MDINQLTSFVDYQLGQKQGWEALSEVLHKLKGADEQVAQAKHIVDQYAAEVDSMKAELAQMDELAKAKELELQARLQALEESQITASRTHQDALGQAISDKQMELSRLEKREAQLSASVQSLEVERANLMSHIAVTQDKYEQVQGQLAAIKGSI